MHPVSFSRALSLTPGSNVRHLRERIAEYLESYERGEWWFVPPPPEPRVFGPRKPLGNWRWEGQAPEEKRSQARPSWELRITSDSVEVLGVSFQ